VECNGTAVTGTLYHLSNAGDTLFSLDYLKGVEHGEHMIKYGNGCLKEMRVYEHGKKVLIHTGYWPNGELRYQHTYENDLYEGTQFEWYDSGKLYSKKNYLKGYEQGLQQVWNTEGRLITNYEAKNGRNYGNIGTKHCVTKK
jgi:antitoxin component YwqK of YwqJK toxin-antitoxin module